MCSNRNRMDPGVDIARSGHLSQRDVVCNNTPLASKSRRLAPVAWSTSGHEIRQCQFGRIIRKEEFGDNGCGIIDRRRLHPPAIHTLGVAKSSGTTATRGRPGGRASPSVVRTCRAGLGGNDEPSAKDGAGNPSKSRVMSSALQGLSVDETSTGLRMITGAWLAGSG